MKRVRLTGSARAAAGGGASRAAAVAGLLEFDGADGMRGSIRAARAGRFADRLRGLVARPLPEAGAGLWIEPCAAVHTFGVRGPIDLAFVSADMVVQRVDRAVPPRRVRFARGARAVLELRAGEAARTGLRTGARLAWRPLRGDVAAGLAPFAGDAR